MPGRGGSVATLEEYHDLGGHGPKLTHRIAALHRLGFHIDRVFSQAPKRLHQPSNPGDNPLLVSRELRRLEKNRRIYIHDHEAGLANTAESLLHKKGALPVLPPGVGVGKEFPYIPPADRSQQRIGQGVEKDISIAVSIAAEIRFDLHPANPERKTGDQSMVVKA